MAPEELQGEAFDLNEAALVGDELPDLSSQFRWEFLETSELRITVDRDFSVTKLHSRRGSNKGDASNQLSIYEYLLQTTQVLS